MQKEITALTKENKKLKNELTDVKEDFYKMNKYIKENFEKTLSFKHLEEIDQLKARLEEKDKQIE